MDMSDGSGLDVVHSDRAPLAATVPEEIRGFLSRAVYLRCSKSARRSTICPTFSSIGCIWLARSGSIDGAVEDVGADVGATSAAMHSASARYSNGFKFPSGSGPRFLGRRCAA